MRTAIELTHLECENPLSILNVTDNEGKSNRKALSIQIRNCKQILKDMDACLKRYKNMSAVDRPAWAWSGHDEVKSPESNLSSLATQLDHSFDILAVKGMGVVYSGLGRIEIALEKTEGNYGAAVKEAMVDLDQSRMTAQCTERYKTIVSDYAKQVSQSTSFSVPRAQTPLLDLRGRKCSKDALIVPVANRSKSADTQKGAQRKKSSPSKGKVLRKRQAKVRPGMLANSD